MTPRKPPARPKKTRAPAGLGSVFQRKDKRWCAAVRIIGPDGKSIIHRRYAHTEAEAEQHRLDLLRDKDRHALAATPRQLFRDYLDDWLAAAAPAVAPNTHRGYTSLLNVHARPALGHLAVAAITPHHVDAILAAMAQKGYASRSIGDVRIALGVCLSTAVERGIVDRNAAKLARAPRKDHVERRFLDVAEVRRLLAVCADHPLAALFTVALAIGLRFGEAAGLRWRDVEPLDAGELRVTMNLQPSTKGAAHRYELRAPKASSQRTIALPSAALVALAQRRRIQDAARAACPTPWGNPWNLVFTSATGQPLDRKNIWRTYKMLLKRASIPDARFHDLRHSAASLLAASGLSLKQISALLGHSSIRVTADIYTHLLPESKQEAADKMDTILGKGA